MLIADRDFALAGVIDAERGPDGLPVTYSPHERFANPKGLPLHSYGRGPFVRLRLPPLAKAAGLYAITVEGEVAYVGIAVNIFERWGRRGYSVIDPRNCFRGGQATNCHINGRLAGVLAAGRDVRLWVHENPEPRPIERVLLATLRPAWNIKV